MRGRLTASDRALITACALLYVYLAILGIGAVWGGCHDPNGHDHSHRYSNYDDCTADGVGHFFLAILTAIDKWNTALTAISTFFIAVFTVVLALVTGRQARLTKLSVDAVTFSANAARDSVDAAKQAFIASHRAWLRVNVTIGSHGANINKNGAGVDICYRIENTGNVPASNITTNAWLIAF